MLRETREIGKKLYHNVSQTCQSHEQHGTSFAKQVFGKTPDLDCRLLGPSRRLPGLPESSTGALSHVALGRHQDHPGDDAGEGGRFPVGAPPRQALSQALGGEQTLGGSFSPLRCFACGRVYGGLGRETTHGGEG